MRRVFVLIIVVVLSMPIFAQVWVARYNGPADSTDEASAIAVDDSGNVYVTGQSKGLGSGYDYATIKYNSSGESLWVARYNGPTNSDDMVQAIAVDDSGNVYVTGWSRGSGPDYDYATIKYNSSGSQVWIARYNGPIGGSDGAQAITVDGSGNVYVTGSSEGSGTSYDYATVEYNSLGAEQWVARYNGAFVQYADNDAAYAIAVDEESNIYVTGWSQGPAVSFDYATVKYDSSGTEQWIARYEGPGHDYGYAIAVDSTGSVYVTGAGGYDYVTVKYNSSGAEQWVARYNGPANSDDNAYALAVDGQDNVYVTGYSEGSGTGNDYATIKYNSSGDSVWVARYNGTGNGFDGAAAIAVDGSGNIYVTGSSEGSSTYSDYATIKYNSSGDSVWVARYNGPGNYTDAAVAIAVNGDYVYVTGYDAGSGTGYDYATIKYSGVGVEEKSNIKNQNAKLEISPNPISKSATIHFHYSIPVSSWIVLKVYDITGRLVKTLVNGEREPGYYKVSVEAKDLSTGIYFAKFVAGDYKEVKKLILVKNKI